MGDADFFRTRMGMRFYEVTMPKIADQLERLNENFEAMFAEFRRRGDNASAATDDVAPRAQHIDDNSQTEKQG